MKNSRSKMIHTVDGVPVIGYTFALELKNPMYKRDKVLLAANNQGFPEDAFPEPTKRNSFKNAMRSQMKMKKDEEKVLHFVEETPSHVIFQVDRKVLENTSLWGQTSKGGMTELDSKVANYQNLFQVVYDKSSDSVVCQNEEVLETVYELLGVYMESYTKLTLTRYVRQLLESNTSFVPYIKGSGVYFVPAHQKDFLSRVIDFLFQVDEIQNTTLCEIPALPNAENVVAKSVTDAFADLKREQEAEINKFIEDSNQLTERMKHTRLDELAKRGKLIEEYQILLNKELKEASSYVKATEMMLKNFHKFGVIDNPFQKLVDACHGNAENLEVIKATVPEDILELIDFG